MSSHIPVSSQEPFKVGQGRPPKESCVNDRVRRIDEEMVNDGRGTVGTGGLLAFWHDNVHAHMYFAMTPLTRG